jgi:hypothetical protein
MKIEAKTRTAAQHRPDVDLASANVQGSKDDDKTSALLGGVAYVGYVLGDVGGVDYGICIRCLIHSFSFTLLLVLLLRLLDTPLYHC